MYKSICARCLRLPVCRRLAIRSLCHASSIPTTASQACRFRMQVHDNHFLSGAASSAADVAVIVLNSDSAAAAVANSPLFAHLWPSARERVCADGGANRLYDHVPARTRDGWAPTAVVGDFDSVRDEVARFYQARGAVLARDSGDQDSTDFEKSFFYLCRRYADQSGHPCVVVAFGALGGRLDQMLAAMHALYRFTPKFARVLLVSDEQLTEVLLPGTHELQLNPSLEPVGATCALVPLATPVRTIRTTGLKWNLKGEPLQLGVRVSTSNRIEVPTVKVETSDAVLWNSIFRPTLQTHAASAPAAASEPPPDSSSSPAPSSSSTATLPSPL